MLKSDSFGISARQKAARLAFASGELTSIVAGAMLSLQSSGAFVTAGASTHSNSALTGLSTNAGTFALSDGAAVTTASGTDFINTGSVNVDSYGVGGSSLAIGGTLTNSGVVNIGSSYLTSAATFMATGLDNTGTIFLTGSNTSAGTQAILDISGPAGFGIAETVTGSVYVSGNALLKVATGGITTIASGSVLALSGPQAFIADAGAASGNSALATMRTNDGTFEISQGSSVGIAPSGSFTNNGTLEINGATLNIAAPVLGTGSAIIGSGGTLELGAADAQIVTFTSNTGMLKLDSPAAFTGHVVGLTGSDVIDFAGFNAATTSASYATSTGELTVADANHSVSIALTGNYANSVFTVASDGHGGVNVVDPPAATLAQSAIAPPALAISGSDASVTSSGSVIGVDGTIAFTAAHPSDPLAASSHALVSGTGSGGNLVLDPIAETHGIGTLGWHFDFDAQTLADLAPGEVMSASYDVTISQAQSSVAATQRLTISVGGSGNDAFVFHPGEGAAVITNFTSQSSTPITSSLTISVLPHFLSCSSRYTPPMMGGTRSLTWVTAIAL